MTPLTPDWDSPYHALLSLLGIPNHPSRFKRLQRNTAQWEERVAALAKWISLKGPVVDLGCGKMTLKRHLGASTSYIGVDFVRRDDHTRIVDLNGRLGLLPGKVAVLSGVIEYIRQLEPVIEALTEADQIVFSYCTLEQFPWRLTRIARGWVNHWSQREVVACFERKGFSLHRSSLMGSTSLFDVRRLK